MIWQMLGMRSLTLFHLQKIFLNISSFHSKRYLTSTNIVSLGKCMKSSALWSPIIWRVGFHKKKINCCIMLQVRTLISQSRRPVPFGLANTFYQRKAEKGGDEIPDYVLGKELLSKLINDQVGETIRNMETEELILCLYAWPKVKSGVQVKQLFDQSSKKLGFKKDANFLIQNELRLRMDDFDIPTVLKCAHAVFKSQGSSMRFFLEMFDYINDNFDNISLSVDEVVKIYFYMYYYGDAPDLFLIKLENYVTENFSKFSFDDIHLISMGTFRVNKRVTNYDILDGMAEKALQNINDIDGVISILKVLRHSGFSRLSFFSNLAEKLVESEMKQVYSLNQIMHLALCFGSLKLYNEHLFDIVISKSKSLLKSSGESKVRTKDVGRLLWALGTFNRDDKTLINSQVLPLIERSLRKKGSDFFPESLVDVAMGMAFVGRYSDFLLNRIFHPATAAKLRDHPLLEKTNQLLFLSQSVKIEHPNYNGTVLSESFIQSLPKKVYGDMDRELSFRQGLRSSYNCLVSLLGKQCVACHFILPHFHTADLEIHLNKDNEPIKVLPMGDPPGMSGESFDEEINSKIAIQIIGQNQCAVNSDMLLGTSQTKIRQLEKLGYLVHVVMPGDAKQLMSMKKTEREDFYKSILCSKFNLNL